MKEIINKLVADCVLKKNFKVIIINSYKHTQENYKQEVVRVCRALNYKIVETNKSIDFSFSGSSVDFYLKGSVLRGGSFNRVIVDEITDFDKQNEKET